MREKISAMKKAMLLGLCILLLSGCAAPSPGNGGNVDIEPEKPTEQGLPGMTLETRFPAPEGFERIPMEDGSFGTFVRGYALKEADAPVLLHNGEKKGNQSFHAAVFALPLEDLDLQQCADSIMRLYAEYYWRRGEPEKIGFHFTNGFFCDYAKWREGYRVKVRWNEAKWSKDTEYDDSYETFVKYLWQVFNYAGTLSMETYETEIIDLSDMTIGDVVIKGGSPGHVVMAVDVCENADGQRAWLLAQGSMPAQEFHVMQNPLHPDDPWYYEEEVTSALKTVEYDFLEADMIRRVTY